MALRLHRKIAYGFGYDLVKSKKRATIDSCLIHHFDDVSIDCVLDVGANTGQFGKNLRDHGYQGLILSFEPGNTAFANLQEASKNDPNWKIFNFALGREAQTQEIHICHNTDLASFLPPSQYGSDRYDEKIAVKAVQTVEVRKLDDALPSILPDFETRNLFLKMDTQGYDLEVFAGAQKSLHRIFGLQSEVAIAKIYDGMPDYLDAMRIYKDAGFRPLGMYAVSREHEGLIVEFDIVMRNVRI